MLRYSTVKYIPERREELENVTYILHTFIHNLRTVHTPPLKERRERGFFGVCFEGKEVEVPT